MLQSCATLAFDMQVDHNVLNTSLQSFIEFLIPAFVFIDHDSVLLPYMIIIYYHSTG